MLFACSLEGTAPRSARLAFAGLSIVVCLIVFAARISELSGTVIHVAKGRANRQNGYGLPTSGRLKFLLSSS